MAFNKSLNKSTLQWSEMNENWRPFLKVLNAQVAGVHYGLWRLPGICNISSSNLTLISNWLLDSTNVSNISRDTAYFQAL